MENIKTKTEERKKKMIEYSRKYRKEVKSGDRCRIYKVNKNTKKYKRMVERLSRLDKKIMELKGGLNK